jgi:hypothetical protein
LAEFYISASGQNQTTKPTKSIKNERNIGAKIYASTLKVRGYLLLKGLEKGFVELDI